MRSSRAAARLGTHCAPGYPDGTDLSGGQWQRIALARALYAAARGARVLVLDEPTAQLDIRAEADFYNRFLELTAGVTTMVISHRFATVRGPTGSRCSTGGRITELGSHDELVAAGGSYAEMFALQAAQFTAASRKRAAMAELSQAELSRTGRRRAPRLIRRGRAVRHRVAGRAGLFTVCVLAALSQCCSPGLPARVPRHRGWGGRGQQGRGIVFGLVHRRCAFPAPGYCS